MQHRLRTCLHDNLVNLVVLFKAGLGSTNVPARSAGFYVKRQTQAVKKLKSFTQKKKKILHFNFRAF